MQFNKLLNSVAGTNDEIPILLAGMLGLRRGEVLGLMEDINFEEKTISIIQMLSLQMDKYNLNHPKQRKARELCCARRIVKSSRKSLY